MIRKAIVAAAAALSLGAVAPDRAQAAPLAAPGAMKFAAERAGHIDKVRYCEFFDPAIGD